MESYGVLIRDLADSPCHRESRAAGRTTGVVSGYGGFDVHIVLDGKSIIRQRVGSCRWRALYHSGFSSYFIGKY